MDESGGGKRLKTVRNKKNTIFGSSVRLPDPDDEWPVGHDVHACEYLRVFMWDACVCLYVYVIGCASGWGSG